VAEWAAAWAALTPFPHFSRVPPSLVSFLDLEQMDEAWRVLKERKEEYGVIVTQVPSDCKLNVYTYFARTRRPGEPGRG
jgi:hypothetical protein